MHYFFIGCGGGSSTSGTETEAVSNIGNNINSLGYYAGTTTFGGILIDGSKSIFLYDEATDSIAPNSFEFVFLDDNIYRDGSLAMMYGVSEDGTVLYAMDIATSQVLDNVYVRDYNSTCIIMDGNGTLMALCEK